MKMTINIIRKRSDGVIDIDENSNPFQIITNTSRVFSGKALVTISNAPLMDNDSANETLLSYQRGSPSSDENNITAFHIATDKNSNEDNEILLTTASTQITPFLTSSLVGAQNRNFTSLQYLSTKFDSLTSTNGRLSVSLNPQIEDINITLTSKSIPTLKILKHNLNFETGSISKTIGNESNATNRICN